MKPFQFACGLVVDAASRWQCCGLVNSSVNFSELNNASMSLKLTTISTLI